MHLAENPDITFSVLEICVNCESQKKLLRYVVEKGDAWIQHPESRLLQDELMAAISRAKASLAWSHPPSAGGFEMEESPTVPK